MEILNLGHVVGLSAYELAVQRGYKGTLDQWLESLRYDHSEEYADFKKDIESALSKFMSNKNELESDISAIRSLVTASMTNIENAKKQAITDIESRSNTALNDISSKGSAAVSEINSSRENALSMIANALENAISSVQGVGETWEQRLDNLGRLKRQEFENAAEAKSAEELTKINASDVPAKLEKLSGDFEEYKIEVDQKIAEATPEDYDEVKSQVLANTGNLATVTGRLDTVSEVIVDTVKPMQAQVDNNARQIDFLKKVSKGQLWDIEQREEEGHAQIPIGGVNGYVDEVRGNTEQDILNGYQLLPITNDLASKSSNGVSISFEDGYVVLNGTYNRSGKNVVCIIENLNIPISAGTYYLIMFSRKIGEGIQIITDDGISRNISMSSSTEGMYKTPTIVEKDTSILTIYINTSTTRATEIGTFNNYRLPIMFTNKEDATFEPYCGGIPSPNPDYPQEIKSVDEIYIRHTDADDNLIDERTIIPPKPLNKIGDYTDKCDIVNGVWEYSIRQLNVTPENRRYWTRDVLHERFHSEIIDDIVFPEVPNKLGLLYSNIFTNIPFEIMYTKKLDGASISNTKRIQFHASRGTSDISLYYDAFFLYAITTPETQPVSESDLDWLRNLILKEGENLYITDNHGRDVSYLMSDYINLAKAVSV